MEDFIVRVVNSQVLSPAGITLEPNTLNGKTITANTITATQIAANTITAGELSSNIALINNVIRSNNFNGNISANGTITDSGTIGWAITHSGVAEFNNVTVRGTVISNTGTIGPFDISSTSFTSLGYNPTNYMVIENYGDVRIFSNPSTGAHSGMRHEVNMVGEYIEIDRLPGGTGGDPVLINRYATMGSDNGEPTQVRFTIVRDNFYKFIADSNGDLFVSRDIDSRGDIYASGFIDAGEYIYANTDLNSGRDISSGRNLYAHGTFRAMAGAGADGGFTISAWSAGDYVALRTNGMTGTEYCMLSEGTNTFVGAGSGGATYIRGPANQGSGQVKVSDGVVEFSGALYILNGPPEADANAEYLSRDNATGRITYKASNRDLKENIEPIINSLDIINNLSPQSFNWKMTAEQKENYHDVLIKQTYKTMGFILEDVVEVSPELVTWRKKEEDGTLYPGYWKVDDFIALAIQGIKDLNEKISNLELEILKLKERM
jgi:hypothetical protein